LLGDKNPTHIIGEGEDFRVHSLDYSRVVGWGTVMASPGSDVHPRVGLESLYVVRETEKWKSFAEFFLAFCFLSHRLQWVKILVLKLPSMC